MIDQRVIPPSPGAVNILRVEPRSMCALIPQHGRIAAPLPWGTLSLHFLQGLFALRSSVFLAPRLTGRRNDSDDLEAISILPLSARRIVAIRTLCRSPTVGHWRRSQGACIEDIRSISGRNSSFAKERKRFLHHCGLLRVRHPRLRARRTDADLPAKADHQRKAPRPATQMLYSGASTR